MKSEPTQIIQLSSFPYGLSNAARTFQAITRKGSNLKQKDTEILPFQEGIQIYDIEISALGSDKRAVCTRKVFEIHQPHSPLIPPKAPDVRSSDESESNISSKIQGSSSELEEQRIARERKNKVKQGRQNRARQRKEVWDKYKVDLAEYNRKRAEREVEDRREARRSRISPYDKIRELPEGLEAISHPNEEQERLREILRTAARRVQSESFHSKPPGRTNSQKQGNESQRVSAFERLGPTGSCNRSRAPVPRMPQNPSYSQQFDARREEEADLEYREARVLNRFPYFAN